MDTNDTYLPILDNIIKTNFPKYYKKTQGLSKEQRKKIPILTQSEVNELHGKYKNEGDLEARDRLIYSQMRLVYFYTKRFDYSNNGTKISSDDLLGFANEILIRIVDEYNPYKKKIGADGKKYNKLPSFIQTWLKFKLHKTLKEYGREIRLPHNQINNLQLEKRYMEAFNMRFGRNPYDNETFELLEKGKSRKYVKKQITFNLTDNSIIIKKRHGKGWKQDNEILIVNDKPIVSGNKTLKGDGLSDNTELFDIIEGEYNIPLDDNKTLINESLKYAIMLLNKRDQEAVKYALILEEPMHNIPSLLTPDYNSKKEVSALTQTSANRIDIYMQKNKKTIHLEYDVIANHHIENEESEEIHEESIELVTHKFKKKQTKVSFDSFLFKVEDAKDIKVIHTTYDNEEALDFSYNGLKLSFNVNYSYGAIFTPQTFHNQQKILIKKLRKQLRKIKNII